MRKIKLTQGHYALVDDEDWEFVALFKWQVVISRTKKYAAHNMSSSRLMMHRIILKAKKGMEVDHINGDGLDNTRKNLRLCTQQQNAYNRVVYKRNTSGFKGVTFHKRQKSYQARIRVNTKLIHLGRYKDKIKAAIAYNEAAKKYHGEFASLNKIPQI